MRLDEITRRGFLGGVGAAALGAGSASTSAASKWYHAATSNDNGWKIYIDLDSIENPESGIYDFWAKINDTNSKNKYPGTANKPIRVRLNMNNRTVGEYVGNNISMSKIAPDSLGDNFRDIFLQWIRDKSPALFPQAAK